MVQQQDVRVEWVGLTLLSCAIVAVYQEFINLSLNSIDVLSGLDTVKICVAYDLMAKNRPLSS